MITATVHTKITENRMQLLKTKSFFKAPAFSIVFMDLRFPKLTCFTLIAATPLNLIYSVVGEKNLSGKAQIALSGSYLFGVMRNNKN